VDVTERFVFRPSFPTNTLSGEMVARLEVQRDLSWVDAALENWLRVSAGICTKPVGHTGS
jgi:hypothetical protein